MRLTAWLMFVMLPACEAVAQPLQDTSIFRYPIRMDSVVVRATRSGWDLQGFIRRVQTDTTFYKAFRSLRLVSFTASNRISILDKAAHEKASYFSKSIQTRSGTCRRLRVSDEQVRGDFYTKSGDYNYYTAELFAYLFLVKGSVCGETDIVAGALDAAAIGGGLAKSKYQLKQLIFNPGARVRGVPFMGDRASLFDADVAKHYDFSLQSVTYLGEECFLFRALPKPGAAGLVVYNELSTWFRKSDYSILARDYALSYHTWVYDFDVRMKVRLIHADGRLVPGHIEYDGTWRVATKGRERGTFTLDVVP